MILVCGEALIDVVHGTDGKRMEGPGGGPFITCARAGADPPWKPEMVPA